MSDILSRAKPATALNRYRALGTYFRWLADEGEIPDSPMRRMKPPHVPEEPPAVLTDDQMAKLPKVCNGTSFEDRRDTAMIRLLVDTGMRRAELAGNGGDEVSRRVAVRDFRRRVEQGECAALFAGRLREAMGDVGQEPGFGEERLAHAASRLVGTTVRAAKADLAMAKDGKGKESGTLAALLEVLGGAGRKDG